VSYPSRSLYSIPLPSGAVLTLGARPLVMGILNVTPDSFADTSPTLDPQAAVDAGLRIEDQGADLLDVGGESTRPGAEPVPVDEERRRVLPVVERLAQRLRIPISIDTYKARVAADAVAAGAALVNDVRGLRDDASLAEAIAASGAALILMHSRGTPQSMAAQAAYGDLIADMARELREGIGRANAAGVACERIIVDPGIGFAKRAAHSYGVLARLSEFALALDRPVLVGVSRKSFLRDAAGGRTAADRDWASAAAVAAAVLGGAHIVRVHAVAGMAQVVRVAEEIRSHQA